MSQSSYATVCTLRFAEGGKSAPVIRALIGAFGLQAGSADSPEHAFIARERCLNPLWRHVLAAIAGEAATLNIELPEDADPADFTEWCYAFAEHLGTDDNVS